MIARLFAGAAHGWSCPVPERTWWVHVSMAPGTPVVFRARNTADIEESLARGQGQWEMYVQVLGLHPDPEGRHAFYCPQRLSDRLAALRGQPQTEIPEPEGRVAAFLERLKETPAQNEEANARAWAELSELSILGERSPS